MITSTRTVSGLRPVRNADAPVESPSDFDFDIPTVTDAAHVHVLIQESPPLEPNSLYAYLLLCSHFAESSVVARFSGELAGCICGYRVPGRPDSLFVWQVAVRSSHRGKGLGQAMLQAIVDRDPAIRFIEATVTPSNAPSTRLFSSYAKRRGCALHTSDLFGAELFPGGVHEPERLIRIGPL